MFSKPFFLWVRVGRRSKIDDLYLPLPLPWFYNIWLKKPVIFQINSTLHSTDINFIHLNPGRSYHHHLQYFQSHQTNSIYPLFFPHILLEINFFIYIICHKLFLSLLSVSLFSMITSFLITLYFTFFQISFSPINFQY